MKRGSNSSWGRMYRVESRVGKVGSGRQEAERGGGWYETLFAQGGGVRELGNVGVVGGRGMHLVTFESCNGSRLPRRWGVDFY
eukprot:746027-Hanusia_phi.AAC.1